MTPKELVDTLYRLKHDASNKELENIVSEAFEQIRYEEFNACADIAEKYRQEWLGCNHGTMSECAANIAARIKFERLQELKLANGTIKPGQKMVSQSRNK